MHHAGEDSEPLPDADLLEDADPLTTRIAVELCIADEDEDVLIGIGERGANVVEGARAGEVIVEFVGVEGEVDLEEITGC